nr:E3 ubiquitin-protein ligase MARCH3-like [Ipomoea trifida]
MGSFASFPNSDFNSLKKRTEKGVLESKSADMSSSKMVECRICHDEGLDSTMETPCSCRGTLKYAHRRCVQRWCHAKGDTVCEICHQPFKPDYKAPPRIHCYGTLRRSAVITSIDVSNSRPFGAWLREQNGNDSSNS